MNEKIETIKDQGWELDGPQFKKECSEFYAIAWDTKDSRRHFWAFGKTSEDVLEQILAEIESKMSVVGGG